jgi:hypothetical protein
MWYPNAEALSVAGRVTLGAWTKVQDADGRFDSRHHRKSRVPSAQTYMGRQKLPCFDWLYRASLRCLAAACERARILALMLVLHPCYHVS